MGFVFVDDAMTTTPSGLSVVVLKKLAEQEMFAIGMKNGVPHGLTYHFREGLLVELCAYDNGKEICGLHQVPHPFNGEDSSHWEYQATNQQIHWLKDCDGRDLPAVALLQLLKNAVNPDAVGKNIDRLVLGDEK